MEEMQQQVYAQLAKVYDPELDEPLTDLGFISSIQIADRNVSVELKLPTFWCAANFAFMMAEDIRNRVAELSWVKRVEVRLKGHFFEEEINQAIAKGLSFPEAFPKLASDDLSELRRTFRRKAFLTRQERLIGLLLKRGLAAQQLSRISLSELEELATEDSELQAALERYRLALEELGLTPPEGKPALVTLEGEPIPEGELIDYRRRIGAVRTAMEANTVLCRQLLEARRAREAVSL